MRDPHDRTDEFAIKGGYDAKKFMFSCIQEGNIAVLERMLSSEGYKEKMEHLFYDSVSVARVSMNFLWAQASMIAIEAGVNERTADNIYRSQLAKIEAADSAGKIIDISEDILIGYAKAVHNIREKQEYSPRVVMCINYIAEHLCDNPSVEEIASDLGFSSNYLSQIFKKETGQTIMSYIQAEKMASAKLMIETSDLPLSTIMTYLGYTSQSHFSQTFKRYIGTTPGKYRKNLELRNSDDADNEISTDVFEEDEWFTDVMDYAMAQGFEEIDYIFSCIRRGKVSALKELFGDINTNVRMQGFFGDSIIHATEVMLSIWPQAARVAMESGVDTRQMAEKLKKYISKLYECLNTGEIIKLNTDYLEELAQAVSEL